MYQNICFDALPLLSKNILVKAATMYARAETGARRIDVQMSKQRLSRLQKWILENCFKVTVLLDRTNLKELNNAISSRKCRACPKTNECVRVERNKNNCITPRCLIGNTYCSYYEFYKEDILLSFFLLETNNYKSHFSRVQHFRDSPEYRKAHVTVHRSINNLIEKGLVYTYSLFQENSLQINLTDKGLERAAELLEIRDYESLIER